MIITLLKWLFARKTKVASTYSTEHISIEQAALNGSLHQYLSVHLGNESNLLPFLNMLQNYVLQAPVSLSNLLTMAQSLYERGLFKQCEQILDCKSSAYKDQPNFLLALSTAKQSVDKFDDAKILLERAARLKPGDLTVLHNMGVLEFTQGRFSNALAIFEQTKSENQLIDSWLYYCKSLRCLGRYNEALEELETGMLKSDSYAPGLMEKGFLLLTLGNFKQGWELYEHRFDHELDRYQYQWALSYTCSDPESAPGELVVFAEQGIGDQIMFLSCMADLMRRRSDVQLAVELRLVNLCRSSFPEINVMSVVDLRKRVNLVSEGELSLFPLGSLPKIFRPDRNSFPHRHRYLTSSDSSKNKWSLLLAPYGGKTKVGISWKGGVVMTGKTSRSSSLEEWAHLLKQSDYLFINLQHGKCQEEIDQIQLRLGIKIINFMQDCGNFEDLAGLICNLDVVVSVQNTTVHLAGALGQRVLALLPENPEWRYGAEGERMPWYSSVHLVRKKHGETWAELIHRATLTL